MISIDFDKLHNRLKEIKLEKSIEKPIDPLRGLTGELRRKTLAGLAGHRSGILTKDEAQEIKRIQDKFDE